MKRHCPKRAEDKENKKKGRKDNKNKRVEVTGGQHIIGGLTVRDILQ